MTKATAKVASLSKDYAGDLAWIIYHGGLLDTGDFHDKLFFAK
jgi:hypothetical protein